MKEQSKALTHSRDSVNTSPTRLSPTVFTFPRKLFFLGNKLKIIFMFFLNFHPWLITTWP